MVSPLILKGSKGSRLVFNIDGNVGPKCPNHPADVQLVQLGYWAVLQNPNNQSKLSTEMRQTIAKISPGAKYSGAPDDPLTLAIHAHEAKRGGSQDGHVSVLKGTVSYDSHVIDPRSYFIMMALNDSLRDTMQGDFPRLDKHTKCPSGLRTSVLSILLGR